MWYFESKLGTLWVVEPSPESHDYILGCDEDEIAHFDSLESVIEGVKTHNTGFIEWDMETKIRTPKTLDDWKKGEPDNWQKFF